MSDDLLIRRVTVVDPGPEGVVVRADQDILIHGSRIVAVQPTGPIDPASAARVIRELEEVWVNPLSNANQREGQLPTVELGACSLPDGRIRCWVKDRGPVNPPAQSAPQPGCHLTGTLPGPPPDAQSGDRPGFRSPR